VYLRWVVRSLDAARLLLSVTGVIAETRAPIERMMTRCDGEPGCAIEVHGFSLEERSVVLARLQRALVASGCCVINHRRRGRRRIEHSFEIELDAALELYCGLVQAGLEMSERSHRVLTQLCVLRVHGCMLDGPAGRVSVRVVTSFLRVDEELELLQVMAASR
jgi:hypothetical protein